MSLKDEFGSRSHRMCLNSVSTTVIQNVNKAQVKVRAKKDNVAGLSSIHLSEI